jgi:tetratricopeptide (TPR) repeat protein
MTIARLGIIAAAAWLGVVGFFAVRMLFPSCTDLRQRGLDELKACDYANAIASFDRVIARDPGFAADYYYRGWAYEKQQRLDRAIADYSEALRLQPANPYAFNTRGLAYLRTGDCDRATQDFAAAIRLDRGYVEAWKNRGRALDKKRLSRARHSRFERGHSPGSR